MSGTINDTGVAFTATGAKITGDFSNATVANRLLAQSSTTNGGTSFATIPNGVATNSDFTVWNNATVTAASYLTINISSSFANVKTSITGAGTQLPLSIVIGETERLRFGTSGQIGIGGANYGTSGQVLVSGGPSSAPTWGSATGTTLYDETASASSTFYPILATNQTSGGLSGANTSSTKLYYQPSTGTLSSTVFNSLSDITQKTNIKPIERATDTLNQISSFEYEWKDNGRKSAGVIAQQLETILPHLVDTNDYGIKSVNYSGLIAYLIQSNKELNLRITELENRING